MWKAAVSLRRLWQCGGGVTAAAAGAPIPAPVGLPLVGTALSVLAAGAAPALHRYVDARHRQLGAVFRERLGAADAIFISDATLMRAVFAAEGSTPSHLLPAPWVLYNRLYGCRRGLFFMDGDEWLSLRRVMNQLMLRGECTKDAVHASQEEAVDLSKRWGQSCGQPVIDIEGELYLWSIRVLVSILLGSQYQKHQKELAPALTHLSSIVHRVFQDTSRLFMVPLKLAHALRLPVWTNFVSTVDMALDLANKLVVQLLPCCQRGEGLLGRMLDANIELTDVKRIVADLVLAAGDTTAYSMQWVLYLLAKNPAIQDDLVASLDGITDPHQVTQLPLLRAVLRETLRLYPVATFLSRYLPQDCQLGQYNIPAGSLVVLSLYTSGRDAKNFPKPTVFWPQRWLRNHKGTYEGVCSPYASLPFAIGARSCIGRRIAETQITLTMAELVRKYRLELMNKQEVEMILKMVAVPSRPVKIRLTQR